MINELTEKYGINTKELFQFFLPLLAFGFSFYTLPWYVNALFFTSILLLVNKEYLFAVYAGLSFYNIMLLKDVPFWASLISSFIALGIITTRIGIIKRKVPVSFFITVLLMLLIVLNFGFKTIGKYFFLTGVKSSLQLIFILLVIQVIILCPQKFIISSREIFEKYLASFLIFYLLTGLYFYDYSDRYGAGTGAQCLALQISLIICYVNVSKFPQRGFQFFLLIVTFLTGSRTYFLLACLILAYDYFKKTPLKTKLIIVFNVIFIIGLALFLLPHTHSRFNYTSETFAGSFWGRFKNYKKAVVLIREHPFTGNGMGSMLRVLENWINQEGFLYYKQNGDTTIVHNEYLRILIELGLLGFCLIAFGIKMLWRNDKNTPVNYMLFLFLMGSLVENTLTLYTTGTLLFTLLIAFAKVSDNGSSKSLENKARVN